MTAMTWTFNPSHRAEHSLDTLAAYHVVQTYRDGKALPVFEQVVRLPGAEQYANALDAARAIRVSRDAGDGYLTSLHNWAVVHPEYECGCVGEAF